MRKPIFAAMMIFAVIAMFADYGMCLLPDFKI